MRKKSFIIISLIIISIILLSGCIDIGIPDISLEYEINFTVNNEDSQLISGAEVTFDGDTKTTNSDGIVIFSKKSGTYNYIVKAADYQKASGHVVVSDSDQNISVTLSEAEEYSINFEVLDESDNPIAGAGINLDGETKNVDNEGKASFSREDGTYNYVVNAEGYQDEAGTIVVEGNDVIKDINLKEELPAYNINFVITDQSNNSILGADINLDGIFKQSNQDGEAVFSKVDGTYDYTVSADGYQERNGDITVSGSDETKDITITETIKHNITFKVLNESDTFISGTEVIFDNESKTTDQNGEVSFTKADGTYNYTVNAEGYVEINDNLEVLGNDVEEIIKLSEEVQYYNINFKVLDESDTAISGAEVIFDNESKTTDQNGEVSFTKADGTYSYTAHADCYEEKSGDVVVSNSDEDVLIILSEIIYDIDITVLNESDDPILDAEVTFDQDTKTTDSEGTVSFARTNGSYNYSISADGYDGDSGTILVKDDDFNTTITLSEVIATTYNINFTVLDDGNDPISGAEIDLEGAIKNTDMAGEVSFSRQDGTYDYTASASGYQNFSDSVTVNGSNENEDINLIMAQYEVQFIVKDESQSAIEGAAVSFNTQTEYTDSNGEVNFVNLEMGTYTAVVTADEYEDFEQDYYIDKNSSFNINLSALAGDSTVSGNVNLYNNTLGTVTSSMDQVQKANIREIDYESNYDKDEYKKSEIIIKYKNLASAQAVSSMEKAEGLNRLSSLDLSNGRIYRYQLPPGENVIDMVSYYNKQKEIEWAEPNYFAHSLVVPNDYYYSDYQWGMVNVNLEAAWDVRHNSSFIKVAVLDTGIIPDHPDLSYNLTDGADFVDGIYFADPSNYQATDLDPTDETTEANGGSHGTHVSGIIGAVGNNSIGVSGINWSLDIIPVRVLNASGSGTHYDIAEGVYYAIDQGTDLINFSLGSSTGSYLLEDAIDYADLSNVVMVAASGNDGANSLLYPAAYSETIAVGATDQNNNRCTYSNYGSMLDLVAPGDYIPSTWGHYDIDTGETTSGYVYMSGTSMAAPHISGIAALLLAEGVNPSNVKARLTSTAIDLGYTGKDDKYGYGLVDAYGALLNKKLEDPCVFAGEEDNDNIYVKSDTTIVGDNGAYNLNQVQSGNLYIYGWRDVNENGTIDDGDYYGRSNLLDIEGSSNYNVDIDMYYIDGSSGINLAVQGF